MAHDELSKNHPGGINDKPTNEKLARMYETKSETDGYKALKMYLSKTNPKCSALFQQPRRGWKEENAGDSCWYENRALGINSLASMMKQISKEAHLSQVYTNHCLRATAITVWGNSGLSDVQICHASGHKDPKNLQNYHHRPSRRQLRTCSNVLADALAGQDPNDTANANQQPQQQMAPVQLNIAPLQPTVLQTNQQQHVVKTSNASSSSFSHGEVFGDMFNSCTIQSVQIFFSSGSAPQNAQQ